MERYGITQTDNSFHIEGFPNAIKFIKIEGEKAQEIADLALHRSDLNFAQECLDSISKVADDNSIVPEALWCCAILHYTKSFGTGVRFRLNKDHIYKDDNLGLEVFEYFQNLRNRHLVHDVNSYAQGLVGAVLNSRDAEHKIAGVLCSNFIGKTLEQGNFGNLVLLVRKALAWVSGRFDRLCVELKQELESESYANLFSREVVTYAAPTAAEIAKRRK